MAFRSQKIERAPDIDQLNALVVHCDNCVYLPMAAQKRGVVCQIISLSTSRHCAATATILAGDHIYVWEDHVGTIVDGGLEEKVNIAQKAIAFIWCKMRRC